MHPKQFLLAAALIAATLTAPAEADSRQRVDLQPPMREHMLANMRDHLAAIETIARILAEGRYGEAADTAESRLGMSAMGARDAEVQGDLAGALTGLADVMQQCVACHAAYRVH